MPLSTLPPHLSDNPLAELENLLARSAEVRQESNALDRRMRELREQIAQRAGAHSEKEIWQQDSRIGL